MPWLATRRERLVSAGAMLGVFAVIVVGAWLALERALDVDDDRTERILATRLVQLRADMAEPTAPRGAHRVSQREYTREPASGGPALEWRYEFDGTAEEFGSHYRRAVPPKGWTEVPVRGMPGQLVRFQHGAGLGAYSMSVFAPRATTQHYRVVIYAHVQQQSD